MLRRQRSGSVVCPSCGRLVGVNDAACFSCGARNPSLFGFAPALRSLLGEHGFVRPLIVVAIVLFVVSLLLSGGQIGGGGLFGLLSPSRPALFVLGASGAVPVFGYGRWWTVLSAGLLHGGLLHIGFNLMWLRDLGPAVARLYGSGRFLLIFFGGSIGGFLATSCAALLLPDWLPYFLRGARELTIGASAGLFGLFGALIAYAQKSGQRGMREVVLGWVLGGVLIGLLPGIDNWAHGGGFVTGWLVARALDPLAEERPVHLLAGLAAFAVALAAVAVSVATSLPYLSG
jgi:rhomboid protease GluP